MNPSFANVMSAMKTIVAWLLLVFACFLPASALTQTAPENCAWEIFSIGYDAPPAEATDIGNRAETSTSNYDSAPILRAAVEKIPTDANRALFGPNAEFKAAEGTADLSQTYNLGLQSSRSSILQANRGLYDQFTASGGTLVRQRDVLNLNADGRQVFGTYNSVSNTITLYKGSNLSTVSEELIHFGQIQKAGLTGSKFPASWGGADGPLETNAAITLKQWGYVPKP